MRRNAGGVGKASRTETFDGDDPWVQLLGGECCRVISPVIPVIVERLGPTWWFGWAVRGGREMGGWE